jgi:hypothetical protein
MNNWCICWFSCIFLLGILIFKGLTARSLYKSFGVKGLITTGTRCYPLRIEGVCPSSYPLPLHFQFSDSKPEACNATSFFHSYFCTPTVFHFPLAVSNSSLFKPEAEKRIDFGWKGRGRLYVGSLGYK